MYNLEGIPLGGRYQSKGHYDIRFIKGVLKEISEGLPMRAAQLKYNIGPTNIKRWIKVHAEEGQFANRRRRLSIQEKRTIVRTVSDGRLSIKEAVLTYKISEDSIKNWQKLYASQNIELSPSNREELSKKKNKKSKEHSSVDQEELQRLQSQLAEAQLKIAALNTLIDVAEEKLKIPIRKKPGAGQS
jgi:transposase